jgi:sulfate permease, SulP family
VPLAALAGLLCVIGVRLIDVSTLIHVFKESKLEALAFLAAAIGTVSGHLMLGLVLGLCIHAVGWFLFHRKDTVAEKPALKAGVRAILTKEHAHARYAHAETSGNAAEWISHVSHRAVVPATSFVHHQAALIGRVVLRAHRRR